MFSAWKVVRDEHSAEVLLGPYGMLLVLKGHGVFRFEFQGFPKRLIQELENSTTNEFKQHSDVLAVGSDYLSGQCFPGHRDEREEGWSVLSFHLPGTLGWSRSYIYRLKLSDSERKELIRVLRDFWTA